MRKWLVLPLWASLGLVVYACDDDTTNNEPKDASVDSPAPTSTMTTPQPDAGLPDNFVPQKDAGPQSGPVTALLTTELGAPAAGMDVYFTDPDGTVTKVVTGADGKATHTMFPGGSLVANYVQITNIGDGFTSTSYYLTTVIDLTPGDTIRLPRPPTSVLTSPGSISGTLANAPTLDAGAVVYGFEPYCGGFTITPGPFPESYSFNVSTDCLEASSGKVPLIATARSTANSSVLALAPLLVGNPDGGTATANVAAGDWVVPTAKQMTFTGALPSGFTGSSATVETPRNGQIYLQSSASVQGPITSPLTYVTAPATIATVVEARSDLNGVGGPGEMLSLSHYQRVPVGTALAEDYGKLLPRMHDLKMAGTAAAPTFTWQVDSALPADGFGTIPLTGTHTPDGGQGISVSWSVVFPVTTSTTSLAVPALPAALLAKVGPDSPTWYSNQITVGASPQAPYALAHQYPTVLSNPQSFAPQIPPNVVFDVKTTGICQNCD